jgi:hypothetical protein
VTRGWTLHEKRKLLARGRLVRVRCPQIIQVLTNGCRLTYSLLAAALFPATHLARGITPTFIQVSCDSADDCVRKLQLFMENGGSLFHL